MANIHQPERRVIESVTDSVSLKLYFQQEYFLNGVELILLGVSPGIGTCSDLHGIDIAVFSIINDSVRSRNSQKNKSWFSKNCDRAVLIRSRRVDDVSTGIYTDQLQYCLVAEGLNVRQDLSDQKQINFELNGKTRLYVPIE